jgi:hypothetical protein
LFTITSERDLVDRNPIFVALENVVAWHQFSASAIADNQAFLIVA